MFGVSFPELLIVMFVALLVFGPEKLPQVARTLGSLMAQFRRTSDQVRREFYNSVYEPARNFEKQLDRGARELVAVSENRDKSAAPAAESPAPGISSPEKKPDGPESGAH